MFQTKSECAWPWLYSAYPNPSASLHYLHINSISHKTSGCHMPSDTNIWGKLHSKTTTKCRYFLFDQAWWRNGEGIRLDYITAALLLKARVNAHEEHAEVTLSHLKIILTDWFLVSYKSIQGLASTVAFLGWGLVTKTAKKKNRVKRLHVTHHMSKIKKKKNQRHPPLDIKGNSPTNLEKAKQTKSCHKKK